MCENINVPESLEAAVSLIENRPATTSLKIAEYFGKEHKNVVRDIRALIADCADEGKENFNRLNFEPVEYTDAKGEKRPMYNIFFDGFMLLVMGYTGKKALQIKLLYIQAFNAMKELIEKRKESANRQREYRARKKLEQAALTGGKDEFEAWLEEVESFRERTYRELQRLAAKGSLLVDKKVNLTFSTAFHSLLYQWLESKATCPARIENRDFDSPFAIVAIMRMLKQRG